MPEHTDPDVAGFSRLVGLCSCGCGRALSLFQECREKYAGHSLMLKPHCCQIWIAPE